MDLQTLVNDTVRDLGANAPSEFVERIKRRVQAAYWIGAHDAQQLPRVPPARSQADLPMFLRRQAD